jgi:glycosyltransferase involved in cell wall biosynthesis
MSPTITVITPVYNGERYLAECIESVLAQTRTDWEYVIVDNCSTDRTAEIAKHYASIDDRIRHVHCSRFVPIYENFSRTIEFMHPDSRFGKFVCADDRLFPECLERMVALAEKYPSVGVVSAHRMYGDRVDPIGLPSFGGECVPGLKAVHQALMEDKYPVGSPTSVLYTGKILRSRKPFFDSAASIHADADAGLRILTQSDLGIVNEVLTFTRLHAGTQTFSFADRINTYLPMFVAILVRYGHLALTQAEYRRAMRNHLRTYWWFLFKARMKASRRKDSVFQSLHNTEIRRVLAELPAEERKTRLILESMLALLADRSGTFVVP